MTFKAVPLDMISAPNYFAPLAEPRWTILDPNAVTLWFQLYIEDTLGTRRYITASGATMTVAFQRADAFALSQNQLTQTAQGLSLPATAHANDRSLFSLALTSQSVQTIVSGTVKFTLVESSVTTTWVQNHALSKKLTAPGF